MCTPETWILAVCVGAGCQTRSACLSLLLSLAGALATPSSRCVLCGGRGRGATHAQTGFGQFICMTVVGDIFQRTGFSMNLLSQPRFTSMDGPTYLPTLFQVGRHCHFWVGLPGENIASPQFETGSDLSESSKPASWQVFPCDCEQRRGGGDAVYAVNVWFNGRVPSGRSPRFVAVSTTALVALDF